jgi:hypothetical protein
MNVRRSIRAQSLFEVIALFVGVLGSISAAAISINSFYPAWVFGFSVALTLVVLYLLVERDVELPKNETRKYKNYLIGAGVAVLAVLFRLGTYTNLQGGQDQGLYVNMSSTLYKWGSVRFPDTFRSTLDPVAQKMYDQTHLSSFYSVDTLQSISTIEFYPLHPALMAICRFIFGGYGHQSLFLMSLLGVMAAWYLALEIDGRKSVAIVFSIFIAVNPALTFFSKFPVSETVALTYVLIGMVFFLRYLRAEESKKQYLNLLISLLSFNCLFYVRWQFILYIPFFLALVLANFFRLQGLKSQLKLLKFVFLILILFGISMIYYVEKQPELYRPIRDSIVDMIPVSTSMTGWGLVLICSALILLALKRIQSHLNLEMFGRVEKFGFLLLPLAVLVSIPSVLSLYRGIAMYPWGYHVPNDVDSWVIRYHYLYRLGLFTSPWLLLVAVFSQLFKPVRNRNTLGLLLFVSICLIGVQFRPYVPYLYYYGRYLIVDVLPGVLLLGAIALVDLWRRRRVIATIFGVFTLTYFLLFSSVQLGKREGENSKFYSEISSVVSKRDVLLVSSTSQQVIVPLRATFEIPTLAIPSPESGFDANSVVDKFNQVAQLRKGKLFYLVVSGSGPKGLTPLKTVEFDDGFFTNTDHYRGDGYANLNSRSRLLLPFRWWHARVSWELYDLNQIGADTNL